MKRRQRAAERYAHVVALGAEKRAHAFFEPTLVHR